jgi:rhodanese-related sulfurtransferase
MFLSFVVSWVGRKFPKTPQITAEELSRQLKLDPSAPLILDCRAEDEYQVGHIKDAKHVDYRADEEAVKRILQDEVTGKK